MPVLHQLRAYAVGLGLAAVAVHLHGAAAAACAGASAAAVGVGATSPGPLCVLRRPMPASTRRASAGGVAVLVAASPLLSGAWHQVTSVLVAEAAAAALWAVSGPARGNARSAPPAASLVSTRREPRVAYRAGARLAVTPFALGSLIGRARARSAGVSEAGR